MASYQARRRDPLLDQNTQAVLERRGKELLGVVLVVLGALVAMLLGSYSPDDPSWMAVSDMAVHNWLGRIGAGIASPLYVIIGRGAWLLPAGLVVWGVRHILHLGEERLVQRIVFFPIGVAIAAVYAALLVPGDSWGQAYGLGGHFGDMVAGSLLGMSPVSGSFGLMLAAIAMFCATVAMSLFVLGFERAELVAIGRRIAFGAISAYGLVMSVAGQGASASVRAAQGAAQRARERRAEAQRHAAELAAWQAEQAALAQEQGWQPDPDYAPPAEARPSLMSRVRRAPEPDYGTAQGYDGQQPELFEPAWDHADIDLDAPQEDRIRSRISRAVQARASAPMVHAEIDWDDAEMPLAESDPAHWQVAPQPSSPVPSVAAAPRSRPELRAPQPIAPVAPPAPPAPVMSTPASVLAAVAARLARGSRAALTLPSQPQPVQEPRLRRAEPPVQAQPRYMPGAAGPLGAAPSGSRSPVVAVPVAAPAPRRGAMPYPAVAPEMPQAAPRRAAPQDSVPHEFSVPSLEAAASASAPESRYRESLPAETFAPSPAEMQSFAAPAQGTGDWAAAGEHWSEGEDEFDRNAFASLDDQDDGYAQAQRLTAQRSVAAPERRVVAPVRKPALPSRQARSEAEPKLAFETPAHPAYEVPPLSLLTNPATISRHMLSDDALEENARMLESVLDDYGVKGEIVSVRPGPVVTMYELEPAPGLKASRVIGLADDIARSMSALSARVSTVPGRSVIGIELPNAHREKVVLREILSARDFGDSNMRLPLALGKDIGGEPVIANLAKMPHLLIAGTTGSGKSVAINTMILSLLYKLSPEECRLIMIDPKMLELSVYDGIPHLLSPVVTDPKKAVVALKWVVGEMEERYRRMSKMGVRNIEGYNGRVREALEKGESFKRTVQTGFDEETGEPVFETDEFMPSTFPYIVVIVDEMADLMMVAGKEIEACIQRLAQMARASGIHLIMATQRPSVDVITGTIKANFPTRISFQVTSKIDSRTILGEQGAEQLLGMGDMLYMGTGSRITRIHGPFVSDEEVEEIVTHLKSFGPPEYMSGVVDGPDEEVASEIDQVLGLGGNTDGEDALYDQAVGIVIRDRKCSTSYIQRKLGIGYNKAARLVEQMEEQGVVSPANHVGKREILVPEQ